MTHPVQGQVPHSFRALPVFPLTGGLTGPCSSVNGKGGGVLGSCHPGPSLEDCILSLQLLHSSVTA